MLEPIVRIKQHMRPIPPLRSAGQIMKRGIPAGAVRIEAAIPGPVKGAAAPQNVDCPRISQSETVWMKEIVFAHCKRLPVELLYTIFNPDCSLKSASIPSIGNFFKTML